VADTSLLVPGGGFDAPVSHFRAALLVSVMTIIVTSLPFLLTYPLPLSQVSMALYPSTWDLQGAGPYHRLDIAADGRMFLDGRQQSNRVDLRMHLDIIGLDRDAGVELRPHPDVRYETFLQTLATVRRANPPHTRIVDRDVVYWVPSYRFE
jgi:hypothetical protein